MRDGVCLGGVAAVGVLGLVPAPGLIVVIVVE